MSRDVLVQKLVDLRGMVQNERMKEGLGFRL